MPEFNGIPTWVPESNFNVSHIPTTMRVLYYVSDQLPERLYNRVQFLIDQGIVTADELNQILISTSGLIDETCQFLPHEISKVTNVLEESIGNFGNVTAEQVVHLLKNLNDLIEENGLIHQGFKKEVKLLLMASILGQPLWVLVRPHTQRHAYYKQKTLFRKLSTFSVLVVPLWGHACLHIRVSLVIRAAITLVDYLR